MRSCDSISPTERSPVLFDTAAHSQYYRGEFGNLEIFRLLRSFTPCASGGTDECTRGGKPVIGWNRLSCGRLRSLSIRNFSFADEGLLVIRILPFSEYKERGMEGSLVLSTSYLLLLNTIPVCSRFLYRLDGYMTSRSTDLECIRPQLNNSSYTYNIMAFAEQATPVAACFAVTCDKCGKTTWKVSVLVFASSL